MRWAEGWTDGIDWIDCIESDGMGLFLFCPGFFFTSLSLFFFYIRLPRKGGNIPSPGMCAAPWALWTMRWPNGSAVPAGTCCKPCRLRPLPGPDLRDRRAGRVLEGP